jgi:hypothetical protein
MRSCATHELPGCEPSQGSTRLLLWIDPRRRSLLEYRPALALRSCDLRNVSRPAISASCNGKDGAGRGDIKAVEVVVCSKTEGLIRADRIILQESARVAGDIFYETMSMGEGASSLAHRIRGRWMHPANDAAAIAPTITDGFAMLVKRADDVEGCRAGSDEERELAPIERAIGVYEGGTLAHRHGEGRQGLSATKEADMTDSTDELIEL